MSLWQVNSHATAFQDIGFGAVSAISRVPTPTFIRYPGDNGGSLIFPVTGSGGGGGLVVSNARAIAFVIGCIFMAILL